MGEFKCWLVVWNRAKLYVDEFFAEVGDGKTEFSVWLWSTWPRLNDFKEGDKGVIVVAKGDGKLRAVHATFVVTDTPKEREDTHPKFSKERGPNVKQMRALVRIDSSFPPISDIAKDLKIPDTENHWVCEIPMSEYHQVREHAETAQGGD